MQKQRRIAHEFFHAEVEHDAVAAVQFHRVHAHLENFFRGEQLRLIAQSFGVVRLRFDCTDGFVEQRAHRVQFGNHLAHAHRHRLMLDEDATALHVVLHVLRGGLEGRHAHAEVFGGDNDFAGAEVDARARHGDVLHQAVIFGHFAILEHDFAVVHKAPAEGFVATGDGQAYGVTRHQKARGALGDARAGQGSGIDYVKLGVVTVGDELLAAVDHPAVAFFHRLGVHHRFGHVVRQPAVGCAAWFGERVRQQKRRVFGDFRKPVLLQVTRRDVRQQHRHLPYLRQLVGQPGVAARDFFRHHRNRLHLGRGVKWCSAKLLRDAQPAHADVVRALQQLQCRAVFRYHVPLLHPVFADKRNDILVDERADGVAHHALFGVEVAFDDFLHEDFLYRGR